MPLPTLPPALFTQADADHFREHAVQWRRAIQDQANQGDQKQIDLARKAKRALEELEEQDAWLLIEEAFQRHPKLDEIVVDVEISTNSDDYYIQVEFLDDRGMASMGPQASQFRARLASRIRDVFCPFIQALRNSRIQRAGLVVVAGVALGQPWAAAREARELEARLPPAGPARGRPVL